MDRRAFLDRLVFLNMAENSSIENKIIRKIFNNINKFLSIKKLKLSIFRRRSIRNIAFDLHDFFAVSLQIFQSILFAGSTTTEFNRTYTTVTA